MSVNEKAAFKHPARTAPQILSCGHQLFTTTRGRQQVMFPFGSDKYIQMHNWGLHISDSPNTHAQHSDRDDAQASYNSAFLLFSFFGLLSTPMVHSMVTKVITSFIALATY